MNNNTKYLLLFLIAMFGLVIIYDSLTKFGMFEGLENQSEETAPATTTPADPATPPATTTPADPATPPATAAPEKKEASSTKKTPVKTFSF
jgi:hypothetical protein